MKACRYIFIILLHHYYYLQFIVMGKLVDLIGGGVGLIAEASSGRPGRGNSRGMNNRGRCHEMLLQGIVLMMMVRLFSTTTTTTAATASKTIFV
jgi:hypothetical protein